MTNEEAQKILEAAATKLGEHFDAVQLMGSWCEGGQTMCVKRGGGNWYARQGMAHEFINMDIAQDHAEQLAAKLNKPDEGDAWKQP